jgi:hypothetical protein
MTNSPSSVDLTTGKVTLSQTLASVTGPGGFGEQLTLQYSTLGLIPKLQTWSLDSTTGIVGLGWQMPLPTISRLGNGSVNDRFLYNGSQLLRKSKTQQDNGWVLTFETAERSMTRITYETATET